MKFIQVFKSFLEPMYIIESFKSIVTKYSVAYILTYYTFNPLTVTVPVPKRLTLLHYISIKS